MAAAEEEPWTCHPWHFLGKTELACVSRACTEHHATVRLFWNARDWGEELCVPESILKTMKDTFKSRTTLVSVYAHKCSEHSDPVQSALLCADGIAYRSISRMRSVRVPQRLAKMLRQEWRKVIDCLLYTSDAADE